MDRGCKAAEESKNFENGTKSGMSGRGPGRSAHGELLLKNAHAPQVTMLGNRIEEALRN